MEAKWLASAALLTVTRRPDMAMTVRRSSAVPADAAVTPSRLSGHSVCVGRFTGAVLRALGMRVAVERR